MSNLNPAALEPAALSGPINEALHLIAVFPHQMEEFGRIESGGFGSEKCLEPPAEVGASPRIQAITASDNPVVTQHLTHRVLTSTVKRLYVLQTASLPSGLRGAHAREASLHRASPRFRCSGSLLRRLCHPLFFPKNA